MRVLAHHYPDIPNWGDMTKFQEWPDEPIDLLCGGTPCQSFSVAGLRKGLDDPRGNLMLTFGAIGAKYRPKWLVWENVPGVLSSNGGRDFGTFLGMLGQLGYGFAYRVLDAQYFGVPQRRRRVFVVGCLGDWRSAAAVLFEQESFKGDSSARWGSRTVHPCLTAKGARAFDDRTGYVLEEQGIRTTTPLEHERLMGFPDGYTLLPGKRSPDTPRFHALGNSWCVPVVRWIGERIEQVNRILESR
ncbi:DNA cytosine methyltransferase [Alcaligenes nematophilus]|uniref:DNA cytosine methyltransferase n=1 Tax=Alcaligenes nematophilus TaxID=2994643 RepID=UPI003989D5F7